MIDEPEVRKEDAIRTINSVVTYDPSLYDDSLHEFMGGELLFLIFLACACKRCPLTLLTSFFFVDIEYSKFLKEKVALSSC